MRLAGLMKTLQRDAISHEYLQTEYFVMGNVQFEAADG